jgi:hypothetical protein
MERVADDDSGDIETAGQAGDGAEIVARVAVHLKGEYRLGSEAEFVRDGNTDALGAHVESEKARGGINGLQRCFSHSGSFDLRI